MPDSVDPLVCGVPKVAACRGAAANAVITAAAPSKIGKKRLGNTPDDDSLCLISPYAIYSRGMQASNMETCDECDA